MSVKPSPPAPYRYATLALALLLAALPVAAQSSSDTGSTATASSKTTHKATSKTSHKTTAKAHSKSTAARHPAAPTRAAHPARTAQTSRIHQAFTASAELRPMAQQLANTRTPEAYAGVISYAQRHTGDAAAAAYLALGHAYLLDKRYAEAAVNLRKAHQDGEALADFADFLGAQASHGAGEESAAESLLHGFTARYPGSIFNSQVPELEATVLLARRPALSSPSLARRHRSPPPNCVPSPMPT
jgi:soluble lytic murein transglycosylase